MLPWEKLAHGEAPDGTRLDLTRRGHEYLIRAGGLDLMSSEDVPSSKSLAELGCKHIGRSRAARVLVGGLGMGYTLRAALDCTGPKTVVELAEYVPCVVEWNRTVLGHFADHPLADPRTELHITDVRERIRAGKARYDAILLDVDNGPVALAHPTNDALYSKRGLSEIAAALGPGGVLGVWSIADEPFFTTRLSKAGFATKLHRVLGSRKGRGKNHYIWVARRP